jgi:hypothetical protein
VTPQENVRSVAASAALEGVRLDEEFLRSLLEVAQGTLDGDALVAQLVEASSLKGEG